MGGWCSPTSPRSEEQDRYRRDHQENRWRGCGCWPTVAQPAPRCCSSPAPTRHPGSPSEPTERPLWVSVLGLCAPADKIQLQCNGHSEKVFLCNAGSQAAAPSRGAPNMLLEPEQTYAQVHPSIPSVSEVPHMHPGCISKGMKASSGEPFLESCDSAPETSTLTLGSQGLIPRPECKARWAYIFLGTEFTAFSRFSKGNVSPTKVKNRCSVGRCVGLQTGPALWQSGPSTD